MPYEVTARKKGEHWRLTDEEAKNMVPGHMALANKYLPEWLREHVDLYAVLMLHGFAIFVRMEIEMKIQDQKKQVIEPEKPSVSSTPEGGISYGKIIERVQ